MGMQMPITLAANENAELAHKAVEIEIREEAGGVSWLVLHLESESGVHLGKRTLSVPINASVREQILRPSKIP